MMNFCERRQSSYDFDIESLKNQDLLNQLEPCKFRHNNQTIYNKENHEIK
jgi:hypothetical protein